MITIFFPQARFIIEICEEKLIVRYKCKKALVAELAAKGYERDPVKAWKALQDREALIVSNFLLSNNNNNFLISNNNNSNFLISNNNNSNFLISNNNNNNNNNFLISNNNNNNFLISNNNNSNFLISVAKRFI